MRNPIFDSHTIFTDSEPGKQPVRVDGVASRKLSDDYRLVTLETPQPLVRIRTDSGIILDISPETAFALAKNKHGALMRWQPIFNPSALNPDIFQLACPRDFPTLPDDILALCCYFAGLVCATGTHMKDRNRATTVTLPHLLAVEVEDRILSWGDMMVADGTFHNLSNRHSVVDMTDGTFYVRSRVLTHLVGDLLSEKLQQPTELLYETVERSELMLFCFFRGLLSSLSPDGHDGLTMTHRDASVVEWCAEILWRVFGVPTELYVDPMEPTVQPGRSSALAKRHRFRLRSDYIPYAVAAGLRDGQFLPAYLLRAVPDPIVSVVPLDGRRQSVIVVPGPTTRSHPLTANGLQFSAAFQMPTGIENIASHPSLVNDPAYF